MAGQVKDWDGTWHHDRSRFVVSQRDLFGKRFVMSRADWCADNKMARLSGEKIMFEIVPAHKEGGA